jgi:hypothetical protein
MGFALWHQIKSAASSANCGPGICKPCRRAMSRSSLERCHFGSDPFARVGSE